MRHRTIIESKQFESDRILFEPDFKRFDEWLETVYWALLRDPRSGRHVEGLTWKYDMCLAASGDKMLTLYYAFNDDRIVVTRLKVEPLGPV